MRRYNGGFGAGFEHAVQFVEEMDALHGFEMFHEVAAVGLRHGFVCPRPLFTQIENMRHTGKSKGIDANKTCFWMRAAAQVQFYICRSGGDGWFIFRRQRGRSHRR